MDPNLLPDNLRNREGREQTKLKKQPVGFGVELNLPEKSKNQQGSAVKKPGFFSNLFGSKPQPISAEKLSMPSAGYSATRSVDLFSSGKNAKKLAKNNSGRIKKQGWLKNLLGRPVSPIISLPEADKPLIPAPPFQKYEPRQEQKINYVTKRAVAKKTGDSWGEIFKGMFNLGRKQRIDFRLASNGGAEKKPMTFAPMPEISRPASPLPTPAHNEIMPKIAPPAAKQQEKKLEAKPARSAYHTAPKHENHLEFNVNLMPQELLARLSKGSVSNIKALIIAVVVPLIIITLAYIGMIFLQNNLKSQMAAKQAEFDGLEEEIGDFVTQEKLNNQVADRVAMIKKVMSEKIIWNNFFDKLEKYTLDGVYFTNLTADTSGVLTLPGVADDYEVLSKQLAAFNEATDFVKEARLTNAQIISEGKAGVVGIGFQLRLTLQNNVFKKTASLK